MTRFIIAAKQRSGTHFFRELINQHPAIHAWHELFLDIGWKDPQTFHHFWLRQLEKDAANITFSRRARLVELYYQHIFNSKPDREAVGVDIKYSELERVHHLLPATLGLRLKVIHIVRRNVLRTFISNFLLNNANYGLERDRGCIETAGERRVKLAANDNLLYELQWRQSQIDQYRDMFKRSDLLELTYEDFFPKGELESDRLRQGVLDSVYDFLEIEQQRDFVPLTKRRKASPKVLEQLIVNLDEIRGFLAGSRWAWMVE